MRGDHRLGVSDELVGWWLPAELADALRAERGRLEWIQSTGELVLLGGIPQIGEGSVDVPAGDAVEGAVPGMFGGAAIVGHTDMAGMVREFFAEEQVPANTRLVLIGRIEHGPRVHEVLWGWHEHHRDKDGWNWLVERLEQVREVGADDHKIL